MLSSGLSNLIGNRILLQPEYEYSGRSAKSAYYILAVDVGQRVQFLCFKDRTLL